MSSFSFKEEVKCFLEIRNDHLANFPHTFRAAPNKS